ncbi:MAG: precorrin-2 dehydrogenase/sirohydrochlorin ferrochelatase family protein [Ktedonobacterales bacterium]
MPNYYPIMLDVRDRPAIVVGGNEVAVEKAASLAASGARVLVQAPEFCSEIHALAETGRVTLRQKQYEPGDLAGAFVVVAAVTYQPDLVEAIWAETQERGQLVNIVDVPERCSFILPSILRRGQLTIAVSTEGASPSLAKRIRQRLETLFPPAYDAYLRLASAARSHLRANGVSYAARDDFFARYEASDTLARLVAGDTPEAAETTAHLLRDFAIEVPTRTLEEAVRSRADL